MKHRPMITGMCLLALLGGISALAYTQAASKQKMEAGESEIKLADAPEAVRLAIGKLTTPANVKKLTKETEHGATTYEVEYTDHGVDCSADLSPGGDVMELERALKEGEIPAVTMKALKSRFPKATLKGFTSVQSFAFEVVV